MTLQACAEIVERADPDRFMGIMAAPTSVREGLFALFAFNVEVARAPWVTKEHMIAEMRLQWWRDALGEIDKGGPVRSHEVTTPLAATIVGAAIPTKVLDELIIARRWDIYREPFEDADHFAEYLDQTAGGLMWAAAKICGGKDERTARVIGRAAGLANWLVAIPELEARGVQPLIDGRPDAVALLAQNALASLRGLRAEATAVPAYRTAWQTRAILRQAAKDPAAVAHGALGQSDFAKKGGLLVKSLFNRW